MTAQSFEREFVDGSGVTVRVRVDVDGGAKLEREILRLANKARGPAWARSAPHVGERARKSATSAGGVLRVTVLSEEPERKEEQP